MCRDRSIPAGFRDMRDFARRRADLCVAYAEDGAYHSAARVARELADQLQAHADGVQPPPPGTEAA